MLGKLATQKHQEAWAMPQESLVSLIKGAGKGSLAGQKTFRHYPLYSNHTPRNKALPPYAHANKG